MITPIWIGILERGSISAVCLCHVADRWFALPIGQGRHLIRPKAYESSFGFITALNIVDPKKIKGVSYQNLAANALKSKEQLTDIGKVSHFQLDTFADLWHRVEAACERSEGLGIRMEGSDSLKVIGKFTHDNLADLLTAYLEAYREPTYIEHYPWINRLYMASPDERAILDESLVNKINAMASSKSDFDRIFLTRKEVVDGASFKSIRYTGNRSTQEFYELHLSDYLNQLPGDMTVEGLNRHKIRVFDENHEECDEWPLRDCLQAEILDDEHQNDCYVLCRGRWYQIERDYKAEIDSWFDREVLKNTFPLPSCPYRTEGEYNRKTAAYDSYKFQSLDMKGPTLGGRSGMEFADLASRQGNQHVLIFNKAYHKRSSGLVYLFGQMQASAELLLNSADFREQLSQTLIPHLRFGNPSERPDSSRWHLVLGIIQDGHSNEPHMPFLAKIVFRQYWQRIRNMGFVLSVTKIRRERIRPLPPKSRSGKAKSIKSGKTA